MSTKRRSIRGRVRNAIGSGLDGICHVGFIIAITPMILYAAWKYNRREEHQDK